MINSLHLAKAIRELSRENILASKILPAFLAYSQKYHLEPLWPAVVRQLEAWDRQEKIFNTMEISSGLPLSVDTVTDIKKSLSDEGEVVTVQKIDQSLVGGFMATYQGIIFDASIRKQLNLLKTKLINN